MPQSTRELRPLTPEDERLVQAYQQLGRPVDDLPYTPEFDQLVADLRATGDSRDPTTLLRRLMALRKAARLPRMGRLATPVLRVPPQDVELVEWLLRRHLGSTGSRDRLPYTDQFDQLLDLYNQQATVRLDPHHFWRLVARVSK